MQPLDQTRTLTLAMPDHLIQHLDAMASRQCCSRAAYVRALVVRDLEQQLTAKAV